mgnify:CR=1 FL=1
MDRHGIVPLSQLPLSNSYMFGEVMRREEVCKLFLEALLGKKIARIEYIGKEEDLSDDYQYHGIRLDVYLEDEQGTCYDVEMQRTDQRSLERRVRYYQSGIDRKLLEKGLDYEDLPESYVIFICDFDYYGKGFAAYERTCCVNGNAEIAYEDGSHAIILNSRYETGNVDKAILEFLDYIRTADDGLPVTSELAEQAKEWVRRVRRDKTKEVPYMTWAMSIRDARKEALAEGRAEGRAEGEARGRAEGRAEGMEKIAKLYGLLVSTGRTKEAGEMMTDTKKRDQLLKEFGFDQ